MRRNIIEKIWDEHVVQTSAETSADAPDILAVDLHLVHEVTSPQAFSELRARGIKMHAANRTVATIDHNVSTGKDRVINTAPGSLNQINAIRENCDEFGVTLLDMESGNQGIVHVIGPELGLTQPGMTIVCGDSHTSTHGAFGALAFGIGTTEVGHTMATGCILQNRPKTMQVKFKGGLGFGVSAKDVVLKLIQTIGVGGAKGHVIEYCGEVIEKMSMEERMTICNMSIECGGRAGLVAPDQTCFEYLKERKCAPKGMAWQRAVNYWESLCSDDDCSYDKVVEIDVSDLAPMVTWGFNPGQAVGVNEKIPADLDELEKQAVDYTKVNPGQEIEGTPVDYVFIGSCTNARISDLRACAEIFRGQKVAEGVKVYIVPGSEKVMQVAKLDGLDKIFEQAGAEFRNPGCSMCLAMNDDRVPEGKRCASTSNRNFVGRQGKGSITHLMSPIMAAAAAITGEITDVRKMINN